MVARLRGSGTWGGTKSPPSSCRGPSKSCRRRPLTRRATRTWPQRARARAALPSLCSPPPASSAWRGSPSGASALR
eukprot:7832657-Alexandrium_andersonii.AAC.1